MHPLLTIGTKAAKRCDDVREKRYEERLAALAGAGAGAPNSQLLVNFCYGDADRCSACRPSR
jgi:hypothetical protein